MTVESVQSVTEREWWAQRWIDVLESFGWRRRLERARNYAREGRVLSLNFQGPQVLSQVQGTAPEPYEVSLGLDPFTDEQWGYVIEELSTRAIFAAKLLAGEMPQTIEDAFTASGLSLFPFSKFDIHSTCDCPDPVNPCKHIGAVYYLLGDYFSQNPFILFELRGRNKAQIIETLRQLRSDPDAALENPPAPTEHLSVLPDLALRFWQYSAQLDPSLVVIAPPPTQENVLDMLGAFPVEESAASPSGISGAEGQKLLEALRQMYQQVYYQSLMTAMRTGE
jgi:uncharacterized Zn finger protein